VEAASAAAEVVEARGLLHALAGVEAGGGVGRGALGKDLAEGLEDGAVDLLAVAVEDEGAAAQVVGDDP